MFNIVNKFFSDSKTEYRQLSVLAVESNKFYGQSLTRLIKKARPMHKVLLVENSEQIFSLMYSEVEIDVIFFDIKAELNTDNITLIKAIAPKISLINWSSCQHPEVIELLYSLGINFFCHKECEPKKLIEALDLAGNYPRSFYADDRLYECLKSVRS
ncbi:response regulator transcription factor [Myxosarcina sp. GI1]|uniref:response regulator transcription factor n=1 Tax=Myxosarcina sp. GI1 TaxID=1541065 RepID=UPI00068C2C4C|nr:response regulator transcription factor [Myxosarcina sp. GI1]